MRRRLAVLLVAMTISMPATAAEKADRILLNGKIETMNPAQPNAEALAIKDGRISFVGSSADA